MVSSKTEKMPKKRNTFSEANLASAINAVLNDGLSKKAAARQFSVSRSTIQHRIKNPGCKTTCGPAAVLSEEEEMMLEYWILECCLKGFPRRKEDLQLSVKLFLDKNERPNPFKNNLPGVGWYKSFMKRHPIISQRTSEHVTAASACVSEKDIKKWFSDIHGYLVKEGLDDILNDPSRLFNGDESGFALCPKTKTVLAPKGSKDVYEVAIGNSKENLTVMFTFNAEGLMCHPMVIFNYKRLPQDIINSVPENWGVGHSDSGWMKSETFYEFIANIFYPFLLENNIKLPVILFVDGHKSHLTYQLSQLCSDFKIILIALYPNSTRILQPADVAAFRPLKSGWKKGVFEWRKNQNNLNKAVSKKDFAPILDQVIKETLNPSILKNGFKACGLYPWNPNQIDYKKCLGKSQVIDQCNTEEECSLQNFNLNTFCNEVGPEMISKFDQISKISETEVLSKEFLALSRIYNLIKNSSSKNITNEYQDIIQTEIQPDDHISNTEMNQNNNVPNQTENYSSFSDIAVYSVEVDKNIFGLCKDQNEVIIDTNNLSDTISSIHTEINILNTPGDQLNDYYMTTDLSNSTISPIQTEINILNTPGDQLNDYYMTTDLSNSTISPIQTEINILNTPEGHNDTLIDTNNDDAYVSSTFPCNVIKKSLQISPLDKCLIWPVTPERKGKRSIERIPYVISSKMWQQIHEQKENAKRSITEEKENKKKKRLENKVTKANKPNSNKPNRTRSNIVKNIFKETVPRKKVTETVVSGVLAEPLTNITCQSNDNDVRNDLDISAILYKNSGQCYKCKTNLSELYKGLDCEFCSCLYHLKCMTNEEHSNAGSNNETILFICALCQKNICH